MDRKSGHEAGAGERREEQLVRQIELCTPRVSALHIRGACDDPDRLYAYRVKEAPGQLDEATGRNLTTALMQIVFERQFQYDFGGLM